MSSVSALRALGREAVKTVASGGPLHKIRVGGVPEHFNTPWHTAIAGGRFEEVGLRVEWVEFPGGTGAMNSALRADEIDVAVNALSARPHTHTHTWPARSAPSCCGTGAAH